MHADPLRLRIVIFGVVVLPYTTLVAIACRYSPIARRTHISEIHLPIRVHHRHQPTTKPTAKPTTHPQHPFLHSRQDSSHLRHASCADILPISALPFPFSSFRLHSREQKATQFMPISIPFLFEFPSFLLLAFQDHAQFNAICKTFRATRFCAFPCAFLCACFDAKGNRWLWLPIIQKQPAVLQSGLETK